MQETRQHILEIIKECGEATVDELVLSLKQRTGQITAVTVRYHLDILREQNLIETAKVRRQNRPGRPQYVYALTEQAHVHFPKNYQALTTHIMEELKRNLPPAQIGAILESVARRMAREAGHLPRDLPPHRLMARAVEYLSEQGYQASWEPMTDGDGQTFYLLHINNCPYHQISGEHAELCVMDTILIASILGTQPGCAGTIVQGRETCTYKARLGS